MYLRDATHAPEEYGKGWTVRYTTDLSGEVDFYVRGEEYSIQLDTWVKRIRRQAVSGSADFAEASITDEVLSAIVNSADGSERRLDAHPDATDKLPPQRPTGFWGRSRQRRRLLSLSGE